MTDADFRKHCLMPLSLFFCLNTVILGKGKTFTKWRYKKLFLVNNQNKKDFDTLTKQKRSSENPHNNLKIINPFLKKLYKYKNRLKEILKKIPIEVAIEKCSEKFTVHKNGKKEFPVESNFICQRLIFS